MKHGDEFWAVIDAEWPGDAKGDVVSRAADKAADALIGQERRTGRNVDMLPFFWANPPRGGFTHGSGHSRAHRDTNWPDWPYC